MPIAGIRQPLSAAEGYVGQAERGDAGRIEGGAGVEDGAQAREGAEVERRVFGLPGLDHEGVGGERERWRRLEAFGADLVGACTCGSWTYGFAPAAVSASTRAKALLWRDSFTPARYDRPSTTHVVAIEAADRIGQTGDGVARHVVVDGDAPIAIERRVGIGRRGSTGTRGCSGRRRRGRARGCASTAACSPPRSPAAHRRRGGRRCGRTRWPARCSRRGTWSRRAC